MPAPRPRGFAGSSSHSTGRSAQNTPMSERQQMALLMQMTSTSASPSSSSAAEINQSNTSHGPARSRDRNERGETALHVAAIKGDQDAVKKLLDSGMSPNVTDFAGWTPLHEACNHSHYNVALTLVKAGANVNAKGLDDFTPLHDAALIGHLKLVKMLVEKGADANFKNRKGKTPADIAVPSVSSYLMSARGGQQSSRTKYKSVPPICSPFKRKTGARNLPPNKNSGRAQQLKKTAQEQKKIIEENNDTTTTNTGNISTVTNKEEDDIYEFKSTPKDSSSSGSEDKLDNRKNEKLTSDEKNISDTSINNLTTGSGTSNSTMNVGGGNSGQTKRTYSDIDVNDENREDVEDNKRKKRKDSDNVKEVNKTNTNRGAPQRQEKGSKASGSSAKSISNITNKANTNLERKSPCGSPKPVTNKTADSDAETDDSKNGENFGNSGPKVPPLKIVIPQQNASGDMETGSRNGKNNSTRNHAALPYVVASSSNSNDSLAADKESASSRCASPNETIATSKNITNTNASSTTDEKSTKATSEERAQQRVLRSSHRSGGGGGGGQNVDRGSNNSSPQLQSSSPSPAPPTTVGTNNNSNSNNNNETNTENSGNNGIGKNASNSTSNSSPANQPQTQQATENETTGNAPSPSASSSTSSTSKEAQHSTVELHPRKRKIRAKQDDSGGGAGGSSSSKSSSNTTANQASENNSSVNEIHPHDHPFTNCYQMFLNIRKQIDKKHRSLFPIQPRPPQGFKDYLMNRRTYALAGKTASEPNITTPSTLPTQMKDLFVSQEKERHKLKMQHIVEKEKLGLTVEQEILRVHGKAARSLACQSLPFSVCTLMRDAEIYNMITPEQEEKDRNARSRYNGRLFLSWLQDVDDKWEKIKEAMVLRHHNEAESLHAVQKMDWVWLMKDNSLCEYKSQPVIDEQHVPIVHVSDDFDLLPA